MHIIIGKRGTGKTAKLIEHCAKIGGTIVCRDRRQVDNIMKMALQMNLLINRPLQYNHVYGRGSEQAMRGFGKESCALLIDNLDDFLLFVTNGHQVEGATININQ